MWNTIWFYGYFFSICHEKAIFVLFAWEQTWFKDKKWMNSTRLFWKVYRIPDIYELTQFLFSYRFWTKHLTRTNRGKSFYHSMAAKIVPYCCTCSLVYFQNDIPMRVYCVCIFSRRIHSMKLKHLFVIVRKCIGLGWKQYEAQWKHH